jgi:hypothetical protein
MHLDEAGYVEIDTHLSSSFCLSCAESRIRTAGLAVTPRCWTAPLQRANRPSQVPRVFPGDDLTYADTYSGPNAYTVVCVGIVQILTAGLCVIHRGIVDISPDRITLSTGGDIISF